MKNIKTCLLTISLINLVLIICIFFSPVKVYKAGFIIDGLFFWTLVSLTLLFLIVAIIRILKKAKQNVAFDVNFYLYVLNFIGSYFVATIYSNFIIEPKFLESFNLIYNDGISLALIFCGIILIDAIVFLIWLIKNLKER